MLLKIGSRKQNYIYKKRRRTKGNFLLWVLSVALISAWVGYKQVNSYLVKPDAILVLGGHEDREHFAAQFAQQHPNIHIWVSGGSPEDYAERIFSKAGIERDRVHLDYRAIDTVTNFTTLVEELKAQGIDSVYLVTSDNHMLRARVIGEVVFGSQGITLKPVSVPSDNEAEPLEKSLRDGARAVLWLITGHTGVEFVQRTIQ